MTLVLANRVKETTSTTGAGTLNLNGAPSGAFQSFVAAVGNGNTCYYCISDASNFEVGVGTVTSGAPNTLSRDTVYASSNGGAKVNWGAGTKDVFLVLPASRVVYIDAAGNPVGIPAASETVAGVAELATQAEADAGTDTARIVVPARLAAYSGLSRNVLTTQGDLLYRGASASARLAAGTSGQFLKTQGGGANPVWADATSGLVFLVAATASASASLDFTNTHITSTYDEYQLHLDKLRPATDTVDLWLRISTDGGSTFKAGASDYRFSQALHNDSAGSWLHYIATAAAQLVLAGDPGAAGSGDLGNAADESISGIIRFWPNGASKKKLFSAQLEFVNSVGRPTYVTFVGHYTIDNSAIDGVRLMMSSGNIADGVARLYGVAKS